MNNNPLLRYCLPCPECGKLPEMHNNIVCCPQHHLHVSVRLSKFLHSPVPIEKFTARKALAHTWNKEVRSLSKKILRTIRTSTISSDFKVENWTDVFIKANAAHCPDCQGKPALVQTGDYLSFVCESCIEEPEVIHTPLKAEYWHNLTSREEIEEVVMGLLRYWEQHVARVNSYKISMTGVTMLVYGDCIDDNTNSLSHCSEESSRVRLGMDKSY